MTETEFDNYSRLMMAYAGGGALVGIGILALIGIVYLTAYWIRDFKEGN